jgi:hypothetical protein
MLTGSIRLSRNRVVRSYALRLFCVVAFAVLSTSCTDTGSGYNLQGVNASSEDFIVSIGTSSGGSFLLKAKTRGTISTGVSRATGDFVVSNPACNEKTRIPWTRANSTLEIASDGSIRILEGHQTFPPDVSPVDHIEGADRFRPSDRVETTATSLRSPNVPSLTRAELVNGSNLIRAPAGVRE